MSREFSIEALARFFTKSAVPMTLASASNPDQPLLLANDAFLQLTGYRREEVLGRNCRFLQGTRTDPKARGRLRHAIDHGTEILVPITNYRKDGSEFENYVFVIPILGPGGTLAYFMGSQYDITAPYRSVSLEEQARLVDESVVRSGAAIPGGGPPSTRLAGTVSKVRGG